MPELSRRLVPAFAYEGGKAALRTWIIDFVPAQGSLYVEPFAGRGNLFWLACCCRHFKSWWLNDKRTAPFYEALEKVDVRLLPTQVETIEEAYWAERKAQGDPVAWVIEQEMVRSGSAIGASTFRGTRRRSDGERLYYNAANVFKKVDTAQRMLRHFRPQVTDWDYTALAWHDWDESVFVYLDPPYLGAKVDAYSEGDLDYQELVQLMQQTRARWLLSEYENPVYKALGKPISRKYKSTSIANSSRNMGKVRPGRMECLWASGNLRG